MRQLTANSTVKKAIFTALLLTVIFTLYQLSVVESIHRFVLVLHGVLSEFQPDISRNVSQVRLLLWTRKTPLKYYELHPYDVLSLSVSNYNRSNPTKILIHGFSDNGLTTFVKTLKKHYLEKSNVNVISVDWKDLAKSPWYTTAAKNSRVVGRYVAEFIRFLISEGASYDKFHILGASLGAHVAGYVGYYTQGKVARITGLDPSGPLFHAVPPSDRLDPSDAQFVDVIHTAGKWVGNSDISGHVDFFANGGLAPQPGCEGRESLDLSCSHRKAWQMYAESIQDSSPRKFFAIQCANAEAFLSGHCCHSQALLRLAIMGEFIHNGTLGTFHLLTNRESPLAMTKEDSINCHL